ncbi:hypothetical protein ILYODFUR_022236 [Ilyodon furcidens]|uniref:DUF4461 domain-containing protein n=1 Tax=Ilyodon furcidens TaxID=33524 RepID=A0ABV0U7I1_9TELE
MTRKIGYRSFPFKCYPTFPPGHTVVFADQSGMNASGEVLLGTMDVHHQWNKLFQQLPSYQSLQQQTDWLKERISDLLGGSQVINLERLGPIQPISEHYMTLSTFHQSLMSRCLRLHPRSLHGLTLVLERKYHCIMLLCSIMSLLCSLKPPVGRGRWPLTLSLVLDLLEVSSC